MGQVATDLLTRAMNDALNRVDPDGEVEYTGNLTEYLWIIELVIKRLRKAGTVTKESIVAALNATWSEDWFITTEKLKLYADDFNQVAEEVMQKIGEQHA